MFQPAEPMRTSGAPDTSPIIAATIDMPRPKSRAASPRSLRVSDAFKAFVLDQLEELGGVVPRSMFGGVGLYRDGVVFGILARDTLFFKTDAANRADYRRARMKTL